MPHVFSPMLRAPDERWQLVNATRETTIATRLEVAFDSRSRRRGLLGRESMPEGEALVIAPSNAIHTCFMHFPIDVLIVDRGGIVLRASTRVQPFRLAAAWRGFAVIELPAGTLAATATIRGDRLAVVMM